jgi:hypothetical protein
MVLSGEQGGEVIAPTAGGHLVETVYHDNEVPS